MRIASAILALASNDSSHDTDIDLVADSGITQLESAGGTEIAYRRRQGSALGG